MFHNGYVTPVRGWVGENNENNNPPPRWGRARVGVKRISSFVSIIRGDFDGCASLGHCG